MLCSILVNYLAALELSAYQKKGQTGRARLVLTVTVLLNLLLLGFSSITASCCARSTRF